MAFVGERSTSLIVSVVDPNTNLEEIDGLPVSTGHCAVMPTCCEIGIDP